MKIDWIKQVALALTIPLVICSCSGSSQLAEGGIGGSGISMGSVSAVGSIWVNGVEYDTTGATIIQADEGTQIVDTGGTAGGTILLPGMVVTVNGSINADGVTGTATSVTYADNLEGPIAGAPTANTFVVLGQTVIVDNLTKFKNVVPADISGLADTDVVEVSGFVDAAGNIRATYIEKKASTTLEIKGLVDTVSPPYSFTIGTLTVSTSGIGFDVSGLQGQFVEVKGSSFVGGVLTASSVEIGSSALSADDYGEAEMEGIVTSVVSATEFTLGGQVVSHDAGTGFNGGLATDIVPGVKLEVEGSLTAGVLIASEISFEDGIELEADIESVNPGGQTITLTGLGLTVSVDDVLTDIGGTATQFSDLSVGEHVVIRARDTGSVLLATKLDASATNQNIKLQGPLDAWNQLGDSVTVLGIVASGFGTYEIDSIGTVTATTFFNALQVGDLMELKGTWTGGVLSWDSVELDD